jgi:hypothetical protein
LVAAPWQRRSGREGRKAVATATLRTDSGELGDQRPRPWILGHTGYTACFRVVPDSLDCRSERRGIRTLESFRCGRNPFVPEGDPSAGLRRRSRERYIRHLPVSLRHPAYPVCGVPCIRSSCRTFCDTPRLGGLQPDRRIGARSPGSDLVGSAIRNGCSGRQRRRRRSAPSHQGHARLTQPDRQLCAYLRPPRRRVAFDNGRLAESAIGRGRSIRDLSSSGPGRTAAADSCRRALYLSNGPDARRSIRVRCATRRCCLAGRLAHRGAQGADGVDDGRAFGRPVRRRVVSAQFVA